MLYVSHSYGKGKTRYSMPGNLWYCLRTLWEWKKTAVFVIALVFIPTVAASYAETLLPSLVVRDLEAHCTLPVLVLHIVGICLVMWIGNVCDYSARVWFERSMPAFQQHFRKKFTDKIMDLDYVFLEDGQRKEIMGNVIAALRHGRGLYEVPNFLVSGGSCVIILTAYGILIARIGWWLLAAVMISTVLSYVLLSIARKKHAEYYGQNSRYAIRTDYISTQAGDAAAGKDIRIYRLLDLFLAKYDESLKEMDRLFGKIHFWYHVRGIAWGFLTPLHIFLIGSCIW